MSSTQAPICRFCKASLNSPKARVCHECGHFQSTGDQILTAIVKPANLLSLVAVVLAFWQASDAREKAKGADKALSDAWEVYDSVEETRQETLRYAKWTMDNQDLVLRRDEHVSDLLRGNPGIESADWKTYDELDAAVKTHAGKLELMIDDEIGRDRPRIPRPPR